MDLVKHLHDQWKFSEETFGPASFKGYTGSINHLKKELVEIDADPSDPVEWADAILLIFDGAMRAGHSPETIAATITQKLEINKKRDWPEWRGTDPDQPIEHVKEDQ